MAARQDAINLINPQWVPATVAAKVRGGALATQSSRDAALFSQMQVIPVGRRVACSAGLHGQAEFLVPTGIDPDGTATKTYPTDTVGRVMIRRPIRLTPGYVLKVLAVCAPTGPTQETSANLSDFLWHAAPDGGYLEVTVAIDNGISNVSKTKHIVPPFSKEQYKSLPSGDGTVWGVLSTADTYFYFDEFKDVGWVEHVSAVVTITAYGGIRPVDIAVVEVPHSATHDDSHREGTIPLYPEKGTGYEYALTGKSYTGDARFGSHQANKTMGDQRLIHGPCLMYWTCWNEEANAVTVTEGDPVTISGTSFRDLKTTAITSWANANPGWSMSSGGTACNLEQSGPLELRGVNAVIPVLCRVYAKMSNAAHTGTVRFQTENYSLRDITVTGSTSYAWYTGLAWLKCGVHQTDFSNLQVLCKTANATHTMSIRYLAVQHYGNFEISE